MSPSDLGAAEGLRAIALWDPDGSAWGTAVSVGERAWLRLGPEAGPADGALGPTEGVEPRQDAAGPAFRFTEEPDGGWRIECEAHAGFGPVTLLAAPEEPPAPAPAESSDDDGQTPPGAAFVAGAGPELCRVSGTVSGRTIEWRGIRTNLPPHSAKRAPGSVRFVTGWLADGSAFGLIAARPRRDDQPDGDAVSATLFDPEGWLAVADPRLSTTYDGAGVPTRVNLELWIGTGEHEFPRRAAAEAAGAPSAQAGLQVIPLRCHSRGEEGAGLYVLATL